LTATTSFLSSGTFSPYASVTSAGPEPSATFSPYSQTPEPGPSPNAKKGLSAGAIAGISIAAVAVVGGAATAAFCLLRRPGGGALETALESSEPVESVASWGVEGSNLGGAQEDNLWGDGGGEWNENEIADPQNEELY
jgi:hypothetical protein